ncbi:MULTISPECIES: hypothetical protein [Arsenicicoccus]|uniref:hypothetical protein n=1 Tax=Arsenicicoccus TaxID=267408 RepID=UPI0004202F10|nr:MULTISPECIES: hypothetical protein [Arsenicicoccus]
MSPATTPIALRAWVDESASVHDLDPGAYILAAAIGPAHLEDDTRHSMRSLRLPGQNKLHWRDEDERRRGVIATTIAALEHTYLVVVREGCASDNLKRRRNKTIERLLPELELLGVTQVTFESRGSADDKRDLDLVQALRGRGRLGPAVRIHHVRGRDEPLLWIPDAVCGAVTNARTTTGEYLDALHERIRLITI